MPARTAEEAAWEKVVEAAKKEGQLTIYAYAFTGDTGIAIEKFLVKLWKQ